MVLQDAVVEEYLTDDLAVRLQRENAELRASLADAVEASQAAADALKRSVPHARLRWQRARLLVTLRATKAALFESEDARLDASEEVERVKREASQSLGAPGMPLQPHVYAPPDAAAPDAAPHAVCAARARALLCAVADVRAEAERQAAALAAERESVKELTKALAHEADTSATLKSRQAELVLTAREATSKLRALEVHAEACAQVAHDADAARDVARAEAAHARRQRGSADAARAAIADELRAARSAHDAVQGELRATASERHMSASEREDALAAVAEAGTMASTSEQLASERLVEAARARAEAAHLSKRVAELERELRLAARLRVAAASSAGAGGAGGAGVLSGAFAGGKSSLLLRPAGGLEGAYAPLSAARASTASPMGGGGGGGGEGTSLRSPATPVHRIEVSRLQSHLAELTQPPGRSVAYTPPPTAAPTAAAFSPTYHHLDHFARSSSTPALKPPPRSTTASALAVDDRSRAAFSVRSVDPTQHSRRTGRPVYGHGWRPEGASPAVRPRVS